MLAESVLVLQCGVVLLTESFDLGVCLKYICLSTCALTPLCTHPSNTPLPTPLERQVDNLARNQTAAKSMLLAVGYFAQDPPLSFLSCLRNSLVPLPACTHP